MVPINRLLLRADVTAARDWLASRDRGVLTLQAQLAAIPAPSGGEGARGRFVAERMRAAGLEHVRTDGAGNVLGRWGAGEAPGVVIASHLDTVFPAELDHSVRGDGTRLAGPGVGDNARGLAAMLAVAEACVACRVAVDRPLTFVATVGEEGEGDLRGARYLFSDPAFRPLAFMALDGPGLERVVHRALGIQRLRAVFRGPGGHSWAAFGVPNPAHAVGVAVSSIAGIELSVEPRTVASVVRVGGGTALNAIPAEAWLETDIRSESDAALERVDGEVRSALTRALEAVNRGRATGTAPLALDVTSLGRRPSGATDPSHPLVQIAVAATRAVGAAPQLAAASTDANIAMSIGVPAVALGAGGRGGDAHLPTEWYENTAGPEGVFRALLVALGAALP